ncbi:MAG: hypothetical protein K8S27_07770 [Candidatus Omnitrophica bacterium]|nr:hypothetical protein [Candidatus Omnitrophota bacterium]
MSELLTSYCRQHVFGTCMREVSSVSCEAKKFRRDIYPFQVDDALILTTGEYRSDLDRYEAE